MPDGFELVARCNDTIEVPVDAGPIKFMIDVRYVELVRDMRSGGKETLEVQLEIRGTDSHGNELVMYDTASLIAF